MAEEHGKVYDVVLSGAGPVGLFLACELALSGCSVLVLEREQSPDSDLKQLPFGIRGLSAPTIEALHRRGLLEELQVHKQLRNPHKTNNPDGPRRQGGHFAGIPFLDGNVDTSRWVHRVNGSLPFSLISTMQELETVFARRAQALGVEISRGCAVSDVQQTGQGVTLQAGEHSLSGRWLVGCDGSRSVIRKTCEFEFAGTEPEFTGYSARVEFADPAGLSAGRTVTDAGMYFQSQPGYLVMVEFDGGAGHRAEPLTLDRLQQVLRRVSGTSATLTTSHAATTWTDRARQATRYRKGRVLLAGDAAHVHSPLGGQGLNLGLGDAMNLGWKLGSVVQGRAPEDLLDSYEQERHPLGARVLDWSRAQVALMRPDPAARALRAIVSDLIETRDGATSIAERVWGISTHYDLAGDHPLVGYSVPEIAFRDGVTTGELLREGSGLVLDFSGAASLKAVARGFRQQLRYCGGPAKDQPGFSAALVRPDGVVAWASGSDPDPVAFERAAARWFRRDTE